MDELLGKIHKLYQERMRINKEIERTKAAIREISGSIHNKTNTAYVAGPECREISARYGSHCMPGAKHTKQPSLN